MRVKDVMTRDVVTVAPAMPLKGVAALLAERRITGVPVAVDGEVVGVVSETDIVAKEGAGEEGPPGRLARLLGRGGARRRLLTARTAADAMASPAVTVESWWSVVAAAWQMAEHRVHRLPVVDHGKLVGIVTRADLVRAFARSDEAIRHEIRNEVLPALGLAPNEIHVAVRQGTVRLEGDVPESEERYVAPAVRRVVGVVDVEADLTVRAPA